MNSQQIKLFSSKKSDNWQTPKWLYDKLNKEFNFDFDPCPLNSTFNGLEVKWGKRNFINPPYSNVKGFLQMAHKELENGNAEICVFLTFANTDTKWFHDYCYNKAEIRFIKGRLKFLDHTGKVKNSAMRPSLILIFRNGIGKKEKDKLKRENKKLKKKLKRAVVFPKSKLSVAEKTLLKDDPNNV
tara:strand:- start:4685 stop:5239 length:555 start_codon:yes stop_codon:yes gene_type:complete